MTDDAHGMIDLVTEDTASMQELRGGGVWRLVLLMFSAEYRADVFGRLLPLTDLMGRMRMAELAASR
jgi:hypothetical protein